MGYKVSGNQVLEVYENILPAGTDLRLALLDLNNLISELLYLGKIFLDIPQNLLT